MTGSQISGILSHINNEPIQFRRFIPRYFNTKSLRKGKGNAITIYTGITGSLFTPRSIPLQFPPVVTGFVIQEQNTSGFRRRRQQLQTIGNLRFFQIIKFGIGSSILYFFLLCKDV